MPLTSHYGSIPDISYKLSYPSLVFAIITPIVVFIRIWSRRHMSGKTGADDWTILASMIFAEAVSIQMIIVCGWAFGKHINEVPQNIVLKTLRLFFVAQFLYKINIGLTKTSILLLYIRVFVQPWFLTTCYCLIGVITAFTVGTVVSSILQCTPIEFAFNKELPGGGTCINMTAFWFSNAAFSILTDLVLIALPVPVIFKLQLPLRTKFALCAVFAVGIFACITSVLRITTLNLATSHLDVTWDDIPSSMWTVIESNMAIICACLPAFKHPISLLFPRLFSRSRKTGYSGEGSGRLTPKTSTKKPSSISSKVAGWSVLDESGSNDPYWPPENEYPMPRDHPLVPASQFRTKSEIRKTTRVIVQYDEVERGRTRSHNTNVELSDLSQIS